jgi:hypothetical protein
MEVTLEQLIDDGELRALIEQIEDDERTALGKLSDEQEQLLAKHSYPPPDTGYPTGGPKPYHIFKSNVGLSSPVKKIVLIGLNPTGYLGRKLLDLYHPETGVPEEDYELAVRRQFNPAKPNKKSKPSRARPRFTKCFRMVGRKLAGFPDWAKVDDPKDTRDGEPVGLIVSNVYWVASRTKKTLPKALRTPAPLEKFFKLIKEPYVVVVHGEDAQEAYNKLDTEHPELNLPPPVQCPHFNPQAHGDLPAIAKDIVDQFNGIIQTSPTPPIPTRKKIKTPPLQPQLSLGL